LPGSQQGLNGHARNRSLDSFLPNSKKGQAAPRTLAVRRVEGVFPFRVLGRTAQGARLDYPNVAAVHVSHLDAIHDDSEALPRVGDAILAVNGVDVENWTARQVHAAISRAREQVQECSWPFGALRGFGGVGGGHGV
jgi:hypothetical protein